MVIFGQPLLRYESVSSTQDVAREKVQARFPAGTIVAAESMTAGRGRRGRVWHVPPGANVCLTAICPPLADPHAAWQIAFLAGLAVVEAVNFVVPKAGVKLRFPNDLWAGTPQVGLTGGGKKVGGVLVETVVVDKKVVPLVGIGINVQDALLPPDLAEKATSLEAASGQAVMVSDIETALFNSLSRRWNEWETGGFAPILAAWQERADFNETRPFVFDGLPVMCRIVQIFENGNLTIGLPKGETRSLHAAQVILGDD